MKIVMGYAVSGEHGERVHEHEVNLDHARRRGGGRRRRRRRRRRPRDADGSTVHREVIDERSLGAHLREHDVDESESIHRRSRDVESLVDELASSRAAARRRPCDSLSMSSRRLSRARKPRHALANVLLFSDTLTILMPLSRASTKRFARVFRNRPTVVVTLNSRKGDRASPRGTRVSRGRVAGALSRRSASRRPCSRNVFSRRVFRKWVARRRDRRNRPRAPPRIGSTRKRVRRRWRRSTRDDSSPSRRRPRHRRTSRGLRSRVFVS